MLHCTLPGTIYGPSSLTHHIFVTLITAVLVEYTPILIKHIVCLENQRNVAIIVQVSNNFGYMHTLDTMLYALFPLNSHLYNLSQANLFIH